MAANLTAFSSSDFMQRALELASMAGKLGEIPVGAVVVLEGKIIGEGYNASIATADPTAHAEIIALRQAAHTIKNYRLLHCSLYVTLEPCLMCAGALVHARIEHLIYGACEPKAGAIVSRASLAGQSYLNHQVNCRGGVKAKECGQLLSDFFQSRRG